MDESLSAEKVYKDLLWQDRGRQSGAICFYGTRVPVQELFDWLDTGSTAKDFVSAFPHVGEERVHAVLAMAGQRFEDLLEAAA